MAVMKKYPFTLDEPLLWFEKHPWTIRDSLEGTAILGDMGSGKTTGSGATLARALLKAGYGGLVLCKKTDECDTWLRYAKQTGRQDQILIVHPRNPFKFNFLKYQFTRAGEGAGYVDNAVQLFVNLIENRREGTGAMRGQDPFWVDGAKDLIRNSLQALILADEEISMDNLRRVVRSLPYAGADGKVAFPQDSYLDMVLKTAIQRYEQGWDVESISSNTPRDVAAYFFMEFARAGANRQSAGILSTFTGMAQPFMSGPVKELFCTETNFVPEFSRKGAIIILNLALDEWEDIGRTAPGDVHQVKGRREYPSNSLQERRGISAERATIYRGHVQTVTQNLRFLIMFLCAEWLVLFRTWVAPSILFPMVLALAIRVAIYMNIPHFLGVGILFYPLLIAMVWHLRGLLSRRSSRNREMYQTPDTGVPWLVIVAQKPKAALALELVIVAAFIFFLHETPVNVPDVRMDPKVQAWMYQNARMVANIYASLGFGGLLLWNLVHFSQRAPSRDEMRQGIKFNAVKQQSHRAPRLQTIKDMVSNYQEEQ